VTILNALVKPGSKLQAFFGNDINSRGEIAFDAFELNGQFHAARAIPCVETTS